jgi:hypothetical protein
MCNLKPKTQDFSRASGYVVPTCPRKILGFGGSFVSRTSRYISNFVRADRKSAGWGARTVNKVAELAISRLVEAQRLDV